MSGEPVWDDRRIRNDLVSARPRRETALSTNRTGVRGPPFGADPARAGARCRELSSERAQDAGAADPCYPPAVICPHCLTAFHDAWDETHVGEDIDGRWDVRSTECPACKRMVIELDQSTATSGPMSMMYARQASYLVRPKAPSRRPMPPAVPDEYAQDYREAAAVLADSPKASAALGRRCLQLLLREQAGATQRDLHDQIQHVLDAGNLPAHLRGDIDAVRNIGNFAAHPMKSQATGEIADVNPGEAEWTLNVLDGLFDFYFVQPAEAQARRDALNQKLASLNKPPMK